MSSELTSAAPTLTEVLQSHNQWLILTGAGCSTKAGLGDYRDKRGEWKRQQPITGQTFREDDLARKRYWLEGLWVGGTSPAQSLRNPIVR